MFSFFSRKGSAQMMWVLIGAILALVVLVILTMLFTGNIGGFERDITSCSGPGKQCVVADKCGGQVLSSHTCADATKICCVQF